MKLAGYRSDCIRYSTAASEQARKLAFAGIAIVWIYKIGENGEYVLESNLKLPLTLFALGLLLDLAQYLSSALIWWRFFKHHEKKLLKEAKSDKEREKVLDIEVLAHPALPAIGWIIWTAKMCAIASGYVFLIIFLFSKLI